MNTNMKTYTQNETPDFEMIRAAAPEEEGARQYYFIEQAKKLWKQQFERLEDSGEAKERYGEAMLSELQAENKCGTFHIATFGCQGLREALRHSGAGWFKRGRV